MQAPRQFWLLFLEPYIKKISNLALSADRLHNKHSFWLYRYKIYCDETFDKASRTRIEN